MKNKKIKFIKSINSRICKNTFFTLIALIFAQFFYDFEFVRDTVEDFSFDKINERFLSNQQINTNSPNLLLFEFDDYYMKDKKLVDKNNYPSYGYLFPRRYIVEFIDKLDNYLISLSIDKKPKALFIDYNLEYTSVIHNDSLSYDDQLLINSLKKDRDYTIFLVKSSNYNFIENSQDPIIQKKIKEQKIIFASVDKTIAKDGISRRYSPWKKLLNNQGEKVIYPNVNIALWQYVQKSEINLEKIEKEFQLKSIIENRIIFKDYLEKKYLQKDGINFAKSRASYWQKYKTYSAHYPFDNIRNENFYNSIIYLGGTFTSNDDVFDISSKTISGIEMNTNALMTLFYLNGKLQRVPVYYTIPIVVGCFFIVSFILIKFIYPSLSKIKLIKRNLDNEKKDIIEVTITMFILMYLSNIIMNTEKLWFTWAIPTGSFIIFAIIYKYLFKRYRKILIEILLVDLLKKMFNKLQLSKSLEGNKKGKDK